MYKLYLLGRYNFLLLQKRCRKYVSCVLIPTVLFSPKIGKIIVNIIRYIVKHHKSPSVRKNVIFKKKEGQSNVNSVTTRDKNISCSCIRLYLKNIKVNISVLTIILYMYMKINQQNVTYINFGQDKTKNQQNCP